MTLAADSTDSDSNTCGLSTMMLVSRDASATTVTLATGAVGNRS
jgi:hypothetical protein